MSYCTVEEVRAMLNEDALNACVADKFVEDAAEREAKAAVIIKDVIEDADAEINGYLAKRYTIPVQYGLKTINKLAKDISLYNLWSRIGLKEDGRENNILTRYKAAVRFLELLAAGTVDIGVSDQRQAAATGFHMSSSPRKFSRDKLRGF